MEQHSAYRRYTYDDFLAYSKAQRCEWVDGVIYDMSGTSISHGRLVASLGGALLTYLSGKPCEVFFEGVEVRFFEEKRPIAVVQPDLKVVCEPEKIRADAIVGAPTLIIEVLSPSTSNYDHITKRRLYERNGVQEYWIVSPEERSIGIYTLVQDRYEIENVETGSAASTCFPDFRIELEQLFANVR